LPLEQSEFARDHFFVFALSRLRLARAPVAGHQEYERDEQALGDEADPPPESPLAGIVLLGFGDLSAVAGEVGQVGGWDLGDRLKARPCRLYLGAVGLEEQQVCLRDLPERYQSCGRQLR